MAREWFKLETSIGVNADDLTILNRAVRRLVDFYGMSPTVRMLSTVRGVYTRGMSAADVTDRVNEIRADYDRIPDK